MKRRFSAGSLATLWMMTLVLAGTLAVPPAAGAQSGRRNPGGNSGGDSSGGQTRAVPRGGSQDSGRDSERGQDRSTPRGGDRADRQGGSSDPGSDTAGRRRGDQPRTGDAVVRTSPPRDGGDRNDGGVIVGRGAYRGFDPWYGYGGYYGGYYGAYDPWFGWYPTYGSPSAFFDDDEGSLRLKVKPVEASVYVDGYYVGIVDDFDGVFQRLHLEAGPHRIEIRAPEYETLSFDVMIEPDHTTTFRGELVR